MRLDAAFAGQLLRLGVLVGVPVVVLVLVLVLVIA